MFIVNSYALAVVFCFVTMLCWGSWGNTQKLASKSWRYELFYWDYVIGMVLFAAILGLTMGSCGTLGRPFLEDLGQASWANIGSVVLGGVGQNGIMTSLVANERLTWVRNYSYNVGFDLAMWSGNLGVEFDAFYSYIFDIQGSNTG